MSNDITNALKYANLQVASEAFLEAALTDQEELTQALIIGNKRNTKFAADTVGASDNPDATSAVASEFAKMWEVVAHCPNTSTGFSGTLFSARDSDPRQGIAKGEQVLVFRSTEFVDDATRDNEVTNKGEIKEHGWAFGQIDDMRGWIQSLQADERDVKSNKFYTLAATIFKVQQVL